MWPEGFASIYGERQEHTLGWEERKESKTDKYHRMDFGKTMNPKRRLFPAWILWEGLSMAPNQRPWGSWGREGLAVPKSGGDMGHLWDLPQHPQSQGGSSPIHGE